MSRSIAILFASALLLGAAPEREKECTGDLARIQGAWTAKAGPKRDFQVSLEIDGHAARFKIVTPKGIVIRAKGEVKIDETASPHALDWVGFRGVNAQELPDVLAIYELKGDTFRVCNGGPDNDRPTEFKPGDGLLAEVVTFERPTSKTKTVAQQ